MTSAELAEIDISVRKTACFRIKISRFFNVLVDNMFIYII